MAIWNITFEWLIESWLKGFAVPVIESIVKEEDFSAGQSQAVKLS
jgi:hypothetical protein